MTYENVNVPDRSLRKSNKTLVVCCFTVHSQFIECDRTCLILYQPLALIGQSVIAF